MTAPEPRVPLLADTEARGLAADVFAASMETNGRVPNLYRALAHAPELLEAWTALAWPLRHAAQSSRAVRELIIMRTALLNGSDYEWRQHWRMAAEAGVSEEQLLDLGRWESSDRFDPSERAALAMADELGRTSQISEPTWRALGEHFDDRGRIELVLTAAFYACVSRVLNGLEVPLEASAGDVPAVGDVR